MHRAWIVLAVIAVAAAGCLAEESSEFEGECSNVGSGDEAGGMRGEHCPNQTAGEWMVDEGI